MQNTTCARPLQTLGLTTDLSRRVSVLGSVFSEDIALLERQIDFVDVVELVGVGVHAFSTFNWRNVVGVASELTTALPAFLPREIRYRRSEYGRAWGMRSAMLTKNTSLSSEIEDEILDKTQLSKIPLGVTHVQVSQSSSVVRPFLPGAMGSSTVC